MPTFIALLNWTEQGIGKVKASPKRLDAGKKAFQKAGCEMKEVFMTMGPYDLVCVVEAPDAEAMAKVILSLGSEGNVRTLTMPAFTEDEYRKIIGSL
jgi:uncharacterized protein with GYD domain